MKINPLLQWDCPPGQAPAWTSPPIPPSQIPPWKRPILTPQTQTLTGNATMSTNYAFTFLMQTTAPVSPATGYVIQLPNGNYLGQTLTICVPSSAIGTTANFLVVGTISGGYASLRFNSGATYAMIQWDGSGWVLVGGNAQLSQATS